MASNSEYEQIRCFSETIYEMEMADIVLKDIIVRHKLRVKIKKAFLNSVITGEYKLEFEIKNQ